MSRKRAELADLLSWSRSRPASTSNGQRPGESRDRDRSPTAELPRAAIRPLSVHASSEYGRPSTDRHMQRPNTSMGLNNSTEMRRCCSTAPQHPLYLLRASSPSAVPGLGSSTTLPPASVRSGRDTASGKLTLQPSGSRSSLSSPPVRSAWLGGTPLCAPEAVAGSELQLPAATPGQQQQPLIPPSPASNKASRLLRLGASTPALGSGTSQGRASPALQYEPSQPAGLSTAPAMAHSEHLLEHVPLAQLQQQYRSIQNTSPMLLARPASRSVLIQEYRKVAESAAVVALDSVTAPEARTAALATLQSLEVVLGSKEVRHIQLATAAHNVKSDVSRAIHSTEKQTSYLTAQKGFFDNQLRVLQAKPGFAPRPAPDPVLPSAPLPAPAANPWPGTAALDAAAPDLVASFTDFQGPITQQEQQQSDGSVEPDLPAGARPDDRVQQRPDYGAGAMSDPRAGPFGAGPGPGLDPRQLVTISPFAGPHGPQQPSPSPLPLCPLSGSAALVASGSRYNLLGAMEQTLRLRMARAGPAADEAGASQLGSAGWDERPLSPDRGSVLDEDELRQLKFNLDSAASDPMLVKSYLGLEVKQNASAAAAAGADDGGGVPGTVLSWPNRGISSNKMQLLRETVLSMPNLQRLALQGNKLSNEDVAELMSILSAPGAPRLQDLDLSTNTNLTWRCALPLALALGLSGHSGSLTAEENAAAAVAHAAAERGSSMAASAVVAPVLLPMVSDQVHRMPWLTRLTLQAVKLGDKGVAQLAEGVRANGTLAELNLGRCGVSDTGGAVLLDALSANRSLTALDLSWNTLRGESARTLEFALSTNEGLRYINLSHNGFGDIDGARVITGLIKHGVWQHVDLSHNTLGPGSALVMAEALRSMGQVAAGLLRSGSYADGWQQQQQPHQQQLLQRHASLSPVRMRSVSVVQRAKHPAFGAQLALGPTHVVLDGTPLGLTGVRFILDAMNTTMADMACAAGRSPHDSGAFHGLPAPLTLSITSCNVAQASDRASSGHSSESEGINPFLPSIASLCRAPDSYKAGKAKGQKKDQGQGSKAGKGPVRPTSGSGGPKRPLAAAPPITLVSPALDLASPAGKYLLDMAHPGTHVLISYLLRLQQRIREAVAAESASDVVLTLADIQLNGKPTKVDRLQRALDSLNEGVLTMTVKAPAQLAFEPPKAVVQLVVDWLALLMHGHSTSPLWKLSLLDAACGCCFFTPQQAIALLSGFDRATQSAECLTAAQMLYPRSVQPLEFWVTALPWLTPQQQQSIKQTFGDLAALDLQRPVGRFSLNLSRSVDRLVALRLQLASGLEASWKENKYFINWLNASLNGQALDRQGLLRLCDYTLPNAGMLRLDYVTYQRPSPREHAATPEELGTLLAGLRACNYAHLTASLALRKLAEQQPPPPPQSQPSMSALRGGLSFRARSKKAALPPPPPPPPAPRMTLLELYTTPLLAVARQLSKPQVPPAPPPNMEPDPCAEPAAQAPPPSFTSWSQAIGFNPYPVIKKAGMLQPRASDGADMLPLHMMRLQRRSSEAGPRMSMELGAPSPELGDAPSRRGGAKGAKAGGGKRVSSAGRDRMDQGVEEARKAMQLAAYLLMVHDAKDLPLLASKMGTQHLAAALGALLLQADGGVRAVAVVLEALPPVLAVKFLYDTVDAQQPLMPPEVRKQVLLMISPERHKVLEATARGANEASTQRSRSVRGVLTAWAARHCLSAKQLSAVLTTLQYETDRVAALVTLWPRIIDMSDVVKSFVKLSGSEQRQVMQRLGYWHVYSHLSDPHGLSFSLNLLEPEHKDMARELVRMAVKETMRARQDARAHGQNAANIQTLLGLHGNGNPVHIPEDEKLWMMIESNFKRLDFEYSPTFEQSLARVTWSVTRIQRQWAAHKHCAALRKSMAERRLEGNSADVIVGDTGTPPEMTNTPRSPSIAQMFLVAAHNDRHANQ